MLIDKIVSGGQTGVDRGGLDAAIEAGIAHGGWCPRGRRAEDGAVPDRYNLTETWARDYAVRTERNVLDADGTLVLTIGAPSDGTALTCRIAREYARPCRIVDLDRPLPPDDVRAWILEHRIRTLNVAGPRESSHPGVQRRALDYLRQVLASD
jgi:hypothetical protein